MPCCLLRSSFSPNVRKHRLSSPKTRKSRNRKGVATLMGMAIFLLLFALAVSYVFYWYQNNTNYIGALKTESAIDTARLGESLTVTAINNNALIVSNPTSQTSVVTQIWSNHTLIWSGYVGIPPFSSAAFSNASSPANGAFIVVTALGDTFVSSLTSQFNDAIYRAWNVTWFNNAPSPATPAALASDTPTGSSFWNDLSYTWEWTTSSPIGLIATTSIMKTSDNNSKAIINFYIDQHSEIQIAIDGILQPGPPDGAKWYNWTHYAYFSINGTQYSFHTITVYYYAFGGGPQILKLNAENATFLP